MRESVADRPATQDSHADSVTGIKEHFEEQAERTPDALAVICGTERLSYGALNAWANQLAFELRSKGATPEDVVALCIPRGGALAAAVLAVIKSGAAYLPLDPGDPGDRLRFMIEDAGARFALAQPDTDAVFSAGGGATVTIHVGSTARVSRPVANPETVTSPDHLMYVIYTSGSTGRPKGVAMHHMPQASLADWSERHYAGCPVALHYFPITSDVGSYELLTTWRSGGCAVIASDAERYDIAALARLVREHGVTRLMLPGSVLDQLAHHASQSPEDVASVREVATTGDKLVITQAIREMLAPLGAFLENQYGSTEVNVVTTARLEGTPAGWPEMPPIGKPMGSARVYVLSADLSPAPVGVPGEIFVGGIPVARGYARRSALTADRFLPDPFAGAAGARMYRMGDMGRWQPDGTLELLGRTDFQIKISGYRVEPAEVESLLKDRPDIAEAAVVSSGSDDNSRLIAYIVPADGPPAPQDLRSYLSARLPGYMVPRTFMMLDRLPLTRTGKVDRRALPAVVIRDEEIIAPRNETEKVIAEVMADVLGLDEVGVHQDFFELGGHSLLIMPIVYRVGARLGVDLPLRALFDAPTVAELAVSVAGAAKSTVPELKRGRR